MKRMACAIALASSTGLGMTAALTPAFAEAFLAASESGLQIAINSTGTGSNDDTVVLGVSYRGGHVSSVALYIDGNLVKSRDLTTRSTHGLLRFELEPGLLEEGNHEIVIKATEQDGSTATTSTHLTVTPSLLSGPVRMLFPRANATVQGVVPIQVKIDDSVRKAFVSFYVDNAFLELSNYAPYTYNWDTTRALNGPHTISIDVIDGETQAKVKTITMHVDVNNPGGLTNRQLTTPDLGAKRKSPLAGLNTGTKSATETLTHSGLKVIDTSGVTIGGINVVLPIPATSHANATGPKGFAVPDHNLPPTRFTGTSIVHPDSHVALTVPSTPGAHATGPKGFAVPDHNLPPTRFAGTSIVRPGVLELFSEPKDSLQLRHDGLTGSSSLGSLLRSRRAGNFAALPGTEGSSPVSGIAAVAGSRQKAMGVGAVSTRGHSLQIAFDNTRIAFDVSPRVENGMPLAPFRQIFEHTGGTVEWYGRSKTVRAFNHTREVEFRIGHTEATVNNKTVPIAARPYIDHGRAIVPLSFVRDAMDVKVDYDASTGHLRIVSKNH